MMTDELQIRVRYAETDQMGYVYYGNYAMYLEMARVELLRKTGFSYKELEERGILMPVLEYQTKYLHPAYYDDLLTIKTKIKKKPMVRIVFEYEILNEAGTLLNLAETTLVFLNKETGRPCKLPPEYESKLAGHFTNEES